MKRFLTVMNTTAARLSALYLLLFSVASIVLVIYMTGVAAQFLVTETRNQINAEIGSLDRVFARGGIRRLLTEVERRSRGPGANLYIITDGAGRIFAGNVMAIEPGVLAQTGWRGRPFAYARFGDDRSILDDVDDAPRAVAELVTLPNGMRLLVGKDIGEPERFREVVRRALIMALSIMGLGAVVIWLFVGRRALKRIDGISQASSRILAGDLSGRLPVSRANDEFDRLSSGLNTMLERISVLNDGLRDVSDSIAHDLKTPLTRLRNRAAQALDTNMDRDTMRGEIDGIVAEADQLIRVFNALLLISRVESGYTKQELAPIDLTAIAEDMADLFGPTVEEQGIGFSSDIAPGLTIKGNRELIGQAVTNLIENAMKYAHDDCDGAQIRLTLKRASSNGHVELAVTDNGPGIPLQDRERVVERFVRLDESRSQPGSGLGLALVSAIAALHGGKMELKDAEPGLRVVLTLPHAP